MTRQIFTTRPSKLERLADYVLASAIAAAIVVGLLAFFNVL